MTRGVDVTAPCTNLIPPNAWDTHCHVFENDRFDFAPGRHFTPSHASLDSLIQMHSRLGIQNVCITQGFAYGPNCTSLLDYMSRYPGTTRGICVLDTDMSTVKHATLNAYHDAGIRSVRINLIQHAHDLPSQINLISACAARLKQWVSTRQPSLPSRTWSIQIQQPRLDFWPKLRKLAATLPVPLVVDHFGLVKAPSLSRGTKQTTICTLTTKQPKSWFLDIIGFQSLLGALQDGNTWIKLSAPYRCSADGPAYEEMGDLVRALVDVAPRRVLWGSDWPHTQNHESRVGKDPKCTETFQVFDDQQWVKSLRRWLTDEEWEMIWVTNPRTLYDANFAV